MLSHSQVLDVVDPTTWLSQMRYLRADLFTFVYFISETFAVAAQAAPYFTHLFSSAKPGSLFLYIDNNSARFYLHFDSLAVAAGLARIAGGEEQFQMEYSEEKRDLEPYFSKFAHSPKIQTSISWRVYQKS